jgi:hypothetical protein
MANNIRQSSSKQEIRREFLNQSSLSQASNKDSFYLSQKKRSKSAIGGRKSQVANEFLTNQLDPNKLEEYMYRRY